MPIETRKGTMVAKTGMSILDFIQKRAEAEKRGDITLAEFTDAMRSKDPDKIQDAVEAMEAAGGYDNLE